MPDGSERKAKSWETSPMDVAKEVSKSLSERIIIAKVRLLFYASKNDSFYTYPKGGWRAVGFGTAT